MNQFPVPPHITWAYRNFWDTINFTSLYLAGHMEDEMKTSSYYIFSANEYFILNNVCTVTVDLFLSLF